jgi:hypothetical protein
MAPSVYEDSAPELRNSVVGCVDALETYFVLRGESRDEGVCNRAPALAEQPWDILHQERPRLYLRYVPSELQNEVVAVIVVLPDPLHREALTRGASRHQIDLTVRAEVSKQVSRRRLGEVDCGHGMVEVQTVRPRRDLPDIRRSDDLKAGLGKSEAESTGAAEEIDGPQIRHSGRLLSRGRLDARNEARKGGADGFLDPLIELVRL